MSIGRFFLGFALAIPQTTPSGGAIAKYVPRVPTPASFISDAKGVLPANAHAALDARLMAIQRAGLGDIAVAILPSIGDYSPNQVAVEIYRTWRVGSMANIGSAHRNVGALILIVPKELAPNKRGECWINTGTGAEGIITDATAGSICRDSIIPHLRTKDYSGALAAGIGALEARLRGDAGLANPGRVPEINSPPGPEAQPASTTPYKDPTDRNTQIIGLVVGGILALVAAIFGVRRWLRYRPRKCPKCGRTMRLLDETADNAELNPGQVVEEQIGSVDYDVWVCDGCGESVTITYRSWFTKYSECRKCHRRAAASKRKVLTRATTSSSGKAEDTFTCKACGATWTVMVTLPRIQTSSSSGGSGGSSGGGGSSFGGSGSSSGGGGGGSY